MWSKVVFALLMGAPFSNSHRLHPRQTLNNNSLPIYKNSSYCIDARVDDLLSHMTLEEKAGQMFHTQLWPTTNGSLDGGSSTRNSTANMIFEKHMTHYNLVGDVMNATYSAEFVNTAQRAALSTRLGIPLSISTDPRHHFTTNVGTGFEAGAFSRWPEVMGLAATRDPELVRKFAEVAREEYLAIGIRVALHPQVDIGTEPRWARIGNTWGEDANLTSILLVEYIKGFQGREFGAHSVSTVTKHFPGGGPMENGEDSHFVYGKNQSYPANNFEHHLIPFKAAIKAGTRQMMPYYSRPIETKYDEVGFSFNRQIVTELLREELGFEGIVLTDWGLITDTYILGQEMPARAWGVEQLSEIERVAKILEAGCDQFGGEQRPELVVEVVEKGLVPESRIDSSVRRLLKEKFILGLFDNPYVDPAAAAKTIGNDYFVRLGYEAQLRSFTLLTNNKTILPLNHNQLIGTKFYLEGLNATDVESYNWTVVATPEEADLAILRLEAPYEPRPGGFESRYHAGSLEYNSTEKARQAAIYAAVPTIVDMRLDRPGAIPEVFEGAAAVLVNYGASREALLDILLGVAAPEGKLPFDLPRSNKEVEDSFEDLPFDTKNPVFRFGAGLSYPAKCGSAGSECKSS